MRSSGSGGGLGPRLPPRLAPRGAPQARPREQARRARAVFGPRRAPAHQRPGRASRGVIRGGARGGREAGGGRRYGAGVVTWPLVTAAATPSRPVLSLVGSGPAGTTSARQRLRETERGGEEEEEDSGSRSWGALLRHR